MQYWKNKILSYLSSILMYRWYGVAVAWVFCLAGWTAVVAIPDQYKAEAKVYIDTQNLMDPLLRGLTISIDPAQEIAIMLKTLITRPTMEQVVHLTDPNANSLSAAQMEDRVANLQSKISIRQLETKNYFAIGYSDNSPDYATSVTQTLLSILQDNRVGGTRLDMDAARAFINKQITDYEQRLRDADKRRADFRTAHIEILGKGQAANRIDAADQAHEQALRELNAAIARRDSIKAQIAATPKTVAMDERIFTGGSSINAGVNIPGSGRAAPVGNPMQRLQQAQAQLEELRTRFTDNYPDVITTKDLIARLQAQLAATPKGQPDVNSVMVTNPAYNQLLDKLSNEETNVAALRQRAAVTQTDLQKARADAAEAIDVNAQFGGLDRDYANIDRMYQQLLQSRESAALSQARDDQNQGVSFRVLDPPQKPQSPSAPNRLIFNSLVLLFGLGCGTAIAAAPALISGKIFSGEDLAADFGVPVIGVISSQPQTIPTHRATIASLAFTMSLVLLFMGYVGVLTVLQRSVYSVLGV